MYEPTRRFRDAGLPLEVGALLCEEGRDCVPRGICVRIGL